MVPSSNRATPSASGSLVGSGHEAVLPVPVRIRSNERGAGAPRCFALMTQDHRSVLSGRAPVFPCTRVVSRQHALASGAVSGEAAPTEDVHEIHSLQVQYSRCPGFTCKLFVIPRTRKISTRMRKDLPQTVPPRGS